MAKDMKTVNITHEDGRKEEHKFDANERRRKIAQAKREKAQRSVKTQYSNSPNEVTEYNSKGDPITTFVRAVTGDLTRERINKIDDN